MGLLDSVLGSVLNEVQGGSTQQPSHAGAGAGLGGIVAMLAANPQLIQALMSLLGNDGQHGGLGGLAAKFQQAGLGDVIGSWIGTGQNRAISGDQLSQVLGQDTLSQLGSQFGIDPSQMAGQLSQVLPGLVDHLTPQGQAPEQGVGSGDDLFGLLRSVQMPR